MNLGVFEPRYKKNLVHPNVHGTYKERRYKDTDIQICNVCSVASRPIFRPNNSNPPEFKSSWPNEFWAEFMAEFAIFWNIGRKPPELSKFSYTIQNHCHFLSIFCYL